MRNADGDANVDVDVVDMERDDERDVDDGGRTKRR
jgi:hypothetical protein